ncbi:MAG: aminopeptidase P family protein [Bacillota bacterium]|nr:aminopeptidase P family protein [Bacillota bacterium]
MNNVCAIQKKLVETGLDALLAVDERNQRYACGFPFTDGAVLVTREKAYLFTDSRYIEAAEKSVDDCVRVELLGREKPLTELIKNALAENRVEKLGAEENSLPHGEYLRYEELLGMELIPAQRVFDELRASKTEEEQQYLREAQDIAEKALDDVLGIIRPGITERDIAAEITYRLLKHGAEGNSFEPIAVTGANSSMPHGVPGNTVVKPGDFVTMDFGCIHRGYCSDMTRTVAVAYATEEMKKVYDTVLKAQLAGIEAARAGIPGCEIDAAARKVIEEAGYGEYFGHSFGHSLGLNIHESPNAAPSCKTIMPPGAVISAEPGIYIPGKFGVRIEDVLILKENGCENITRAPKELIIL